MKKRLITLVTAVFLGTAVFGCGNARDALETLSTAEDGQDEAEAPMPDSAAEFPASLVYDRSMELSYAEGFSVDYFQGGYALATIENDGRYLVIPEGMEAPEDMDGDIVVLQRPVTNIYLAASAVMDMFVSLDALDDLRFSALDHDSWYIGEAREMMETGDLLYAGKYSAPDYELILSEGCGLAVENTMIYHTPEVKEELEQFDIPVLVDYSSYESDPLGRMEWVKLYGVLTDREKEAQNAFEAQAELYEDAASQDRTDQTVAFFYITSNGAVNVRKTSDYLPRMIESAGGTYIFDSLGGEDGNASSTVSMQMEEFYAAAKDADYLIYNSTIEGELESMDDLLALSPLLENFSAVRNGRVYCTTKNLYQASMELGTITSDIHKMLTNDTENMTYLYRVE